jgi:hypothetical protein
LVVFVFAIAQVFRRATARDVDQADEDVDQAADQPFTPADRTYLATLWPVESIMGEGSPMSTTNDQEVIDAVTRRSQMIVAGLIAGVVFLLAVSIVLDPLGSGRRRVVAGAGPGAVQGRGADAKAVPRPAMVSVDFEGIITWVEVAFAAMLLLISFVVPGRIATQNRRSIAAGTWTPPSGQNPPRPPFGPEVLESDPGKLAFVYQTQFIVGACSIQGVAFFAALAYMGGKEPIALGLGFLLLATLIVRFPTRARVAAWIDRQEELLVQERRAAITEGQPIGSPSGGNRIPSDRFRPGCGIVFYGLLFFTGCWGLVLDVWGLASGVENDTWGPSIVLLLSAVSLVVGGGGLFHCWKNRRKPVQQLAMERAVRAGGAALRVDPDRPTVPALDLSQSPGSTLAYRLPIDWPPERQLMGCLFFTLVWNGATAAFAVMVLASHLGWWGGMEGITKWLMIPLGIIFVLVGLFLIYLAVGQLLVALGVGPTTVEVSDHPLVPGGCCEVFLSQSGRLTLKMNSLRVLCICEEEAKHTDGGDTSIETRRVFEEEIIAQEGFELQAGLPFEVRGELRLPPGAMHSLVAMNNQVRWKVVVLGDVARWPNFERGYPIVVLPSSEVAK